MKLPKASQTHSIKSLSNSAKPFGKPINCCKSHLVILQLQTAEILEIKPQYIYQESKFFTLFFHQIEPQKKGHFLILPSSSARNSQELKTKRIFQIQRGILEIIQFIQFIHLEKHLDGAWDTFGKKITQWHFHSASKEDIWPKNFSNSMQGLKSAIMAIFQRGPGWPCPVSTALKNPSLDLKNSFCFEFL